MMKKIIGIILIGLLVAGCSNGENVTSRRVNVCDDSTIEQRSSFILQCIANANPNSDEEPEDWIRQCQGIAEDTYCEKKTAVITRVKDGVFGMYVERSREIK